MSSNRLSKKKAFRGTALWILLASAGAFHLGSPATACEKHAAAAQAKKGQAPLPATVTTTALDVKGLLCGNCSKKVRSALEALPGVFKVDIDAEENQVQVTHCSEKAKVASLTQAVRDAGFSAELVSRP